MVEPEVGGVVEVDESLGIGGGDDGFTGRVAAEGEGFGELELGNGVGTGGELESGEIGSVGGEFDEIIGGGGLDDIQSGGGGVEGAGLEEGEEIGMGYGEVDGGFGGFVFMGGIRTEVEQGGDEIGRGGSDCEEEGGIAGVVREFGIRAGLQEAEEDGGLIGEDGGAKRGSISRIRISTGGEQGGDCGIGGGLDGQIKRERIADQCIRISTGL